LIVDLLEIYKDRDALIVGTTTYKYSDLLEGIYKFSDGSQAIKFVASIEGELNFYFITLFIYLLDHNYIVLPSSKNLSNDELDTLGISIRNIAKDDITITSFVPPINELISKQIQDKKGGLIIGTSGTTGKKKYALHDTDMFLSKYKDRNSYKTLLYMSHDSMGGLDVIFSTLLNGGCLIVPKTKSIQDCLSLIETHKIELLPITPSFINLMLTTGEYLNYDLNSLKIITYGSERMSEESLKKLIKEFPDVKLKQMYGSTETGTLKLKTNDLWIEIDDQIKIEDDLLYVKNNTSFLGYINYESPIKDGWIYTGDRVEVSYNYYRVLGRDSEVINTGGYKVYPEEVEEAILQHSFVKDVLVRKESNGFLGEIVVADVMPISKPAFKGFTVSLIKKCREILEPYKIPIKINLVDNIEYTDSGKKRRAL